MSWDLTKGVLVRYISLILLGFSLVLSTAWASPRIEIVQSVPAETSLAVPGIRLTQTVWLEMIRGAKATLDLEHFYVSDEAGQALSPVLQEIKNAGARGVKVRLLVDAKFFKTYPDSVTEIGSSENCEARTISFEKMDGVQHAKYFVVDGRNSFPGSQNFDWRALSHIHEVGLRIDDKAIGATLERIFETDWAAGVSVNAKRSIPSVTPVIPLKDSTLQVVGSPEAINPAGTGPSLTAILSLMNAATRSIRIQVMSYSTHVHGAARAGWHDLDKAIKKAAARGVRVELMVDASNIKKAKADLASLALVKGVTVRTLTIPTFSGGIIPFARLIHSKYLLVDGVYAWVGSENWSESYFFKTRNVGIVTSDPSTVRGLGQIFEKLWRSEYALTF